MGKPLRILIIEDSIDDADLLIRKLRQTGYDPVYERIETASAMKIALEKQEWDIVVADYSLPNFSAVDALSLLQRSGLDLPFIIVSGTIGEDVAVASLKAGAHDYIMKDNLTRLIPAIERELKEAEERREHKQAEEAKRKSQASLANAQRIAHLGNWEWNIVKNEVRWSDEIYHIFGLVPESFNETYEAFLNYVHPDDREFVKKSVQEAIYERKPYSIDHRIILPDGAVRVVHEEAEVIFDSTGKAVQMNGTVQDITERKRAEEEVNLLLTMTKAIAEAESLHTALDIVLREVCKSTGWIYGEAWLPSPDGKHLECSQAWHNGSEKLKEFRKKSEKFNFTPGVGLSGRVWVSKKPEWKRDFSVDGEFPRAPFAREAGLKAAMSIPVIANNEVIAVLVFFVREQRHEDERLIRLVSAIAVQLGSLIQRKRAEEALRQSEEKLKSILDNAAAMIYVKDLQGRHTFINDQFEKLIYQKRHLKRGEVIGKDDYEIWPKQLADLFRASDQKVTETGKPLEFDETVTLDDGTHSYFTIKFPLFESSGNVCAVCGISTDVSERKRMAEEKERLYEQLYHARRLESVGKLAGAIAHDFNNILSGVIGYGELLLGKIKKGTLLNDDSTKDYVQRLLSTAERAVNLIQGLLTFSKKQVTDLKPVNLNKLIKRAENILSGLIREDIKFKTMLAEKDCIVMADSGQLERVLMNLTTNARDAMPDGGLITLSTDIVKIDNEFKKTHGYGEIGWYARISLTDTGVGMDKETQEKIFEPFFTTKKSGKGTGLGLSIAYAIVKQHRGYINVHSERGKGTKFEIYLPVIESAVEEVKPEELPVPAGGTEVILLAEDDDEVRELNKTVLEGAGYRVIDAVDGEDAVDKFMKNKDTIQLLLLDVMMPKKDGKEAYDEIRKVRQDIKALFVSGYAEDVIDKKRIRKEGLHFISKPVLPTVLLRRVREELDKTNPVTTR